MFEYATVFFLSVNKSTPSRSVNFHIEVKDFVSENLAIYDFIDFDSDFYLDHEKIQELKDGEYWVYARGIAEFESDVDWETGIEQGHFILGVDKINIKKYSGDIDAQA
jgi:hypothetical protein